MKSLFAMNRRWGLVALLLVALSLAGCGQNGAQGPQGSGGDTGIAGPVGPTGTTGGTGAAGDPGNNSVATAFSVVQGNLTGDAAAGLTVVGGPATVPITTPVSVVLVNEGGIETANMTVTASNGNFVLLAPKGHSYMMLLREGNPTGRTIGPVMVDKQTGRVAFDLPAGSPDVDFGGMTMDSQLGKAWCGTNPPVAPTTAAFLLDQIAWYGDSNIPSGGSRRRRPSGPNRSPNR